MLDPIHKRVSAVTVTALSLLLSVSASAVLPSAVGDQRLPSLAPVLEQVTPSVVNIYTETRVQVSSPFMDDPFFRRFFNLPNVPRERVSRSLGSGVIVDADAGYILTNHHVINEADDIAVTLLDGRSFDAELVGSDADTDIAVIRIDAQGQGLQALSLNTAERLRVGDFVVAVGNPFGLGQTVTSGIVSALGRAALNRLEFQNFIQTDASINPGNSGGALINLNGELVGINTAIFTPSGGNVGIGFAIPVSMAERVMQQLTEYGVVRRGTFGLETQDLTQELAAGFGLDISRGAVVARVLEQTPADEAGIKAGDVIIEANGEPVRNAQTLTNIEGLTLLGESVEVVYLRDGSERQVRLATAVPPNRHVPGGLLHPKLAGMTLDAVPERSRLTGALIEAIESDSLGASIGLREGDVITAVNRVRVNGIERLRDLLEDIGGRERLRLQIQRGRRAYLVDLD